MELDCALLCFVVLCRACTCAVAESCRWDGVRGASIIMIIIVIAGWSGWSTYFDPQPDPVEGAENGLRI